MYIQNTMESIKYLCSQIINTPLFLWCISTLRDLFRDLFRICNILYTMEDIHGAGNAGPFNQFVSLPFFWLLLYLLFILCSICVFLFVFWVMLKFPKPKIWKIKLYIFPRKLSKPNINTFIVVVFVMSKKKTL
jgi:hypothetical protein